VSDWDEDCLLWRGAVLTGRGAHWCGEWDDLPVDETCPEWPCCHVAFAYLPRKLKKWAKLGYPNRRSNRWIKRLHRILERAQVTPPLTGGP